MIAGKPVSFADLTWTIARDVNRTLGGGLASMELLRRTFIERGLLDERGNGGLVAVSRLTPGTTVLAYCVALGWSLRRWSGAAGALLAGSVPASLVVCALAMALVRVHEHRAVRMLLAIGVAVATYLVFSSAWSLLRPYVQKATIRRASVIALVSGVLLVAGVTPVRILLLCAVLGAIVAAWRGEAA